MMRFLRYNSRHTLYHHPEYTGRGGVRIVLGWSLNPIGSMYDGRHTVLHEPLWSFRLRQRLFAFAGRQRCGRRGELHVWDTSDVDLPDTWDMGPDGNRTCSYCGSIHPEDLMVVCRRIVDGVEGYSLGGTDKSYKVYVRIPGVVNASQGAIKFYRQHAPRDPSEADQQLFSAAMRVSHQLHEARMVRFREEMARR